MFNYWEVPVKDFIKEELSTYAKDNNLTPQETVDKLCALLPSAYEDDWKDYPSAVKAWMTLQMYKSSPLSYFKSEDLGEFIYDTNMYHVPDRSELRYNDRSGLEPILPKGLKSCNSMFYQCELPEGFTLGDKFDTSSVTSMGSMFCECKLPEGFTLGDKFDISNVTHGLFIFSSCELNGKPLTGSAEDIIESLTSTTKQAESTPITGTYHVTVNLKGDE